MRRQYDRTSRTSRAGYCVPSSPSSQCHWNLPMMQIALFRHRIWLPLAYWTRSGSDGGPRRCPSASSACHQGGCGRVCRCGWLPGQAAASRLLLVACARLPTSSGGEARAETPPLFVHPPAALRLSRFDAVRWGGRGGVAHGAGGCGSAFPSSPAVIGLVALTGGRGDSRDGRWHRAESSSAVLPVEIECKARAHVAKTPIIIDDYPTLGDGEPQTRLQREEMR
jgi:hypothetical protein